MKWLILICFFYTDLCSGQSATFNTNFQVLCSPKSAFIYHTDMLVVSSEYNLHVVIGGIDLINYDFVDSCGWNRISETSYSYSDVWARFMIDTQSQWLYIEIGNDVMQLYSEIPKKFEIKF